MEGDRRTFIIFVHVKTVIYLHQHFSFLLMRSPVFCRRLLRRVGGPFTSLRYSSTTVEGASAYEECDVVIVGGGPVGLALAGALSTHLLLFNHSLSLTGP
jgi:hypothetical protein